MVTQGVVLGSLRPLDPVKVAAVCIEANIAMISQRLLFDHPDPVERDAGILYEILLEGIKIAGPAVVEA